MLLVTPETCPNSTLVTVDALTSPEPSDIKARLVVRFSILENSTAAEAEISELVMSEIVFDAASIVLFVNVCAELTFAISISDPTAPIFHFDVNASSYTKDPSVPVRSTVSPAPSAEASFPVLFTVMF